MRSDCLTPAHHETLACSCIAARSQSKEYTLFIENLTTATAGAGATDSGLDPLTGATGAPDDAMTGELSRPCTTSDTDGLDSAAAGVSCPKPAYQTGGCMWTVV